MILVLDHKDSFTGNLVHLLHNFGEVKVLQSPPSKDCLSSGLKALVLSPGPGHPHDYPESLQLYQSAKQQNILILGVCLGFQMILHAEGAKIIRQPQVLHGVQTSIICDPNSKTYRGLPQNLQVGRYHSLQVDPDTLPENIQVTAWDDSPKVPLSFEMKDSQRIFGLQYHPDSFLTDNGYEILRNTLDT
jgi:anthranilate synthase/aminodeoxychorismate synthase-like glutamine amidotransferase